ncbi:peptide-methionine (S)-S-oxide reductase [cyanobiont of Ornithocercus magnificus]|nr:peptide-methionine (S)-S-oxide reductase [cyanobiont of Ornithocercus magnificus]
MKPASVHSWLVLLVLLVYLSSPALVFATNVETAVFAGGCFWCLEHDLGQIPGVISVKSGYTGGTVKNPTYSQVTAETTGHQESVEVRFDLDRISYRQLLHYYWQNIDPFDPNGQFCDKGDSYQAVIFTRGELQSQEGYRSIEWAIDKLNTSPSQIKVRIEPASTFWPAEEYHQNFAERNALKYNFYRYTCGRDRRLEQVWGSGASTQ